MGSKQQILFPKHQKIMEQVGEQIKLARKRRGLTTEQVAERAGINRTTLYHIERGKPSVAIGAYFNVLRVLNLHEDFLELAADDEANNGFIDYSVGDSEVREHTERYLTAQAFKGDAPYPDYPTDDLNVYEQ
ncbi:MAG: helix-turn-helix domain-containing protein [Bacteroidetes bacterium]|nr:helix-turn-helix domain-containing protein [Bacteroidota bacterium]